MSARQTKIMIAQFKKATAEPAEFIKFALKSDNEVNIWYILLSGFSGNNNEFEGGEYLCRMEAPADFPYNPPHFYMLTRNGVYDVEKKVCISIGEFHKDNYRAALGMAGFANQLVSGMIGWRELGDGIAILKTTESAKSTYAANSRKYNMATYPHIMNKIIGSYNEYSSGWFISKDIDAKLKL